MKASEFHELAGRLAAGSAAADARSSISRSYYAVYHTVIDFVRSERIVISRKGEAHSKLGQLLCGTADEEIAVFGRLLGNLSTQRTHADYDLDNASAEKPRQAYTLWMGAEDLLRRIQDWGIEPRRAAVGQALREYAGVLGLDVLPPPAPSPRKGP